MTLKTAILAGGLALAATQAPAGGLADAIMEMPPEIVAAEAQSSSSNNIVAPLILLALIALAMSQGSGGGIVIDSGPSPI